MKRTKPAPKSGNPSAQKKISSFFAVKSRDAGTESEVHGSSSPIVEINSAHISVEMLEDRPVPRIVSSGNSPRSKLPDRDYASGINPGTSVASDRPSAIAASLQKLEKFKLSSPSSGGKAVMSMVAKRRRSVSPPKIQPAKRAKGKPATTFTPLEQQVLAIKSENQDTILVVEVGYKYRFFGDDALVAAKELNIVAFMKNSMMTASIPVHRVNIHVKRLVERGYKVGIVKQMETAALKAAGDNKSAPFTRKLVNVYTKATFIEDADDAEELTDSSNNCIMCILEEPSKQNEGNVAITMMAVALSTGEICYDVFSDEFMRCELNTRLYHVQPAEFLLPPSGFISQNTEKLVELYCYKRGGHIRIERIDEYESLNIHSVKSRLQILAEEFQDRGLLSAIERLNKPSVYICLVAVRDYLKEFGLENVFTSQNPPKSFKDAGHMTLNSSALASLEIFETEAGATGSLFWVLDHTCTSFGKRLFRKWVARPLINFENLTKRMEAVEELLLSAADLQPMTKMLSNLPDLERLLIRIQYRRCNPSELITSLSSFLEISKTLGKLSFKSQLLRDIVDSVAEIRNDVLYFSGLVNLDKRSSDLVEFFRSTEKFQSVCDEKQAIVEIENELGEHLKYIRKTLKKPDLQYTTVNLIEFLVEIKNTVKNIPNDWLKINGTKAVSRFHTPFIIEKLQEREQHRELLHIALKQAYQDLLKEISSKFDLFRDVVSGIATLDALLSLAQVASQPGYSKPTILQSENPMLKIIGGRHPMVEKLLGGEFVSNDLQLDAGNRCIMITGPNMGGKSSYIRQTALIAILSQIGSYVPADSVSTTLFDQIFTRMGASDDMMRGESTFMRELIETSEILHRATPRSLIILDELGRGTSTFDGTAIAGSVFRYCVEDIRCFTLFVTHYPSIADICKTEGVRVVHMGFLETDDDSVVFLYKVTDGLANRSFGLNVAKMAKLQDSIIEKAKVKSVEMEEKVTLATKKSRNMAMYGNFRDILKFGDSRPPINQMLELLHRIADT